MSCTSIHRAALLEMCLGSGDTRIKLKEVDETAAGVPDSGSWYRCEESVRIIVVETLEDNAN